MIVKAFKTLKKFLYINLPDELKKEFNESINKINITRAKYIALAFIFLESMVLTASIIIKKNVLFKGKNPYYIYMYIFFLMSSIVFLLIFIKLGKNMHSNSTSTNIAEISFTVVTLFWCAGISLLDQSSSSQTMVYMIAVIGIAVTSFFKPSVLFLIYFSAQTFFIIMLPHFDKHGRLPFGNFINSTTFIIISWLISYMRYKNQVTEFNDKRIIKEKNNELKRMNKKLEEANRELTKFSQTDSLTRISNRFMFDKTIGLEWNRCKCQFAPLSLIMIDIDYFKAFNDNYGHQAGDDCLRQMAGALSACAKRSSDTVARYGGEEFAVILPNMKKKDALELAEQMRKIIESLSISHAYSLISHHITISLGINTVVPSSKTSVEEFIRNADKALYNAKLCRNKTVVA